MRLTRLRLRAFRGFSDEFELPIGGHNVLIFGENGASKSSIARALELLFDPQPDRDLLTHKNLFGTAEPSIIGEFEGHVTNTNPKTGQAFRKAQKWPPLEWTAGKAKPLPSWLLSSAARSAFLDHRKLLLLSEQTRGLGEAFFLAAVSHLFAHLPVAATGNTVGALWEDILQEQRMYRTARARKGQSGATGVKGPVAHRKVVETKVNALNQALDDYLVAPAGQTPLLVGEAERLLGVFEGKLRQLKLKLTLDHLVFSHRDGALSGGRLNPCVTFCNKDLTTATGAEAVHHRVLNEARLTAIALAVFFAAVKLQDAVAFIKTSGGPDEPARLLVLDDVLVGLDYDHRVPVLNIIRDEFVKVGYQVVLLTHDRVWFDLCRLEVENDKTWVLAELYSNRGRGKQKSDMPTRKKTPSDLIKRATFFLNQDEWPAAANYARTAVETALKSICDTRHIPVPFRVDPEKHDTNTFLDAVRNEKRKKTDNALLVPKGLQQTLRVLRKTVLSSAWPGSALPAGGQTIDKNIAAVEELLVFLRKVKETKGGKNGRTLLIPADLQGTLKALRKTVLNPLSHGNSTTVGRAEIERAISAAQQLARISERCKPKSPS